MSSRKFDDLEHQIEQEYERRYGYSAKRAQYIGRATAGKVYREKLAKQRRKHGDKRRY